jgi:hypothetical protein
MLQSAGYVVELADSQKRTLELVPVQIGSGSFSICPAQVLRDKVPKTIVLGHRTDETLRRTHLENQFTSL